MKAEEGLQPEVTLRGGGRLPRGWGVGAVGVGPGPARGEYAVGIGKSRDVEERVPGRGKGSDRVGGLGAGRWKRRGSYQLKGGFLRDPGIPVLLSLFRWTRAGGHEGGVPLRTGLFSQTSCWGREHSRLALPLTYLQLRTNP